jgi:hypothetical protein
MREGEVGNLFLVRVGQRVQGHPERGGPRFHRCGERRLILLGPTDLHRIQVQTEGLRRLVTGVPLGDGAWRLGIPQHGHVGHLGKRFFEQLQAWHWFSLMGTFLPFEITTYAI